MKQGYRGQNYQLEATRIRGSGAGGLREGAAGGLLVGEGLKKEHIIRLTLIVDSERPQEMFARLNLRHGPNTEQIVRELDLSTREMYVEFDLFYTNFKEVRAQSLWFDLIFESPSMNQITIRDISIIRRRRANT